MSLGEAANHAEALPSPADPASDPRYIGRAIRAVGISGLGGPFRLDPSVEGDSPVGSIFVPRTMFNLFDAPPVVGSLNLLYPSEGAARYALSRMPAVDFTYYVGPGGFTYPTIITDDTAPSLCGALREAVLAERSYAKEAARTGIQLALWYVGARAAGGPQKSVKPPEKAPVPAPQLKGFTATENVVIREVRGMLASEKLHILREAYKAGKPARVLINGRTVQYEPELLASGMTMFGENGFYIGPKAFSSSAELTKTLLHELHRLATRTIRTGGASQAGVTTETEAAFALAERAYATIAGAL